MEDGWELKLIKDAEIVVAAVTVAIWVGKLAMVEFLISYFNGFWSFGYWATFCGNGLSIKPLRTKMSITNGPPLMLMIVNRSN